MGFWSSTLSNFVAGAALLIVGALFAGLARRIRRALRKGIPPANPAQRTAPKFVYIPAPNSWGAGLAFVLILIGFGAIVYPFYWVATHVPQEPFGRPLAPWLVVAILGFPVMSAMWRILIWVSLRLSDPTEAKKPLSQAQYKHAHLVAGLITYILALFLTLDPFGWVAAYNGLVDRLDNAAAGNAVRPQREQQP